MKLRFVVIFEEGAEMMPVRERLEPAHLAYLEQHRDEIPMAGGLRNSHGGAYVGGFGCLMLSLESVLWS
jgi:uncharacterized protein YciI